MALSPSIPTSFVPKQPVTTTRRKYSGGNNIFLFLSLIILFVAILASAGVFLYAQYLTSVENTKAAELVSAQGNASAATVQQFLRLSNRLTAAKSLLNNHVELSQFFTLLGTITAQNVSFDSLSITVADDRSATIELTGSAKDFNSLAVESNTFASQKGIKSAIFSGININPKDNSVEFQVDATLDPSLVVENAAPTTPALLPAAVPVSTSTPAASLPSASVATSTNTNTAHLPTSTTPIANPVQVSTSTPAPSPTQTP